MFCRAVLSLVAFATLTSSLAAQVKPSFDCTKAKHEIELLVCGDPALAALDVKLADAYKRALKQGLSTEQLDELRAEQRGWTKGRDECWKESDKRACTAREYSDRTVTLQATYGLVISGATTVWLCGSPPRDVNVTPFETDPPTVNLVRDDDRITAIKRQSASGMKYEGAFGVLFWSRGNEATLEWPQGKEEKCTPRR